MKPLIAVLALFAAAAPAEAGESVTYDLAGAPYEGYYAEAPGSKGLVVIIHDWDGLTDYERKRADMLAELGYSAFAIDLFGKGNRPADVTARKAATAKLYEDRETMRALLAGGFAEARKRVPGQTVVMGYCFGGAAALELARSGQGQDVKGYTAFHGGLNTPAGQTYPADTAPILIAHGGADQAVPMKDVAALAEQLEKAGITYEIEVYSGAPHAFTVFGSEAYREQADQKSWDAFQDFLDANLGG